MQKCDLSAIDFKLPFETSIKAIGRLSDTSGAIGTLISQSMMVLTFFVKKDHNSITLLPVLRHFALISPLTRRVLLLAFPKVRNYGASQPSLPEAEI